MGWESCKAIIIFTTVLRIIAANATSGNLDGHVSISHVFVKRHPIPFFFNFVLFTMDSFMNVQNDGYDLSYNTNARFSQPERTFLNHGHASEVSVDTLHT